jgi:hypothetical protein
VHIETIAEETPKGREKDDYRALRKQRNEIVERARIEKGARQLSCLHTGMIANDRQTENWLF